MEQVDAITVTYEGEEKEVALFVGDVTALPEHEAVDVLVVSAFPDDYVPTPTWSGRSTGSTSPWRRLAADKEVDLRTFSSCWLSRPIERPDLHFKRILCFEPRYRRRPPRWSATFSAASSRSPAAACR